MSGTVKGVQKLFVGGLPWTIGTNELKHYFSKFGPVAQASVVFDKGSGLSKGYGFVSFGNRDGLQQMEKKNYHKLEGRVLTIQPAAS